MFLPLLAYACTRNTYMSIEICRWLTNSLKHTFRHFGTTLSWYIVVIMNGVGIIARIVPNYLADHAGPLTMLVPAAISTDVLVLCWGIVSSPVGLYVWVSFYGVTLGGIQALFPSASASASFTTDLQKQGTRIGMVFMIVSYRVLIGPPIAGVPFCQTRVDVVQLHRHLQELASYWERFPCRLQERQNGEN